MAKDKTLKRYLDAGMAFTETTQAKAEALVKELVKTGEMQAEQTQAAVADLIDWSRKNTEEFLAVLRKEIAESVDSLGLATVADLARLEKLIEAIRPGSSGSAAAGKKSTAKKSTSKKSATKKSTAKKTAAKASAAKKTVAKKAPAAKKTVAKKASAAKKTVAKKAPTKKASTKKAPTKKASAAKKTVAKKTTG